MSNNIYKIIQPTYLYIKRHLKTNLRYFGKTIKVPGTPEFQKYFGSGKRWSNHLKIHGTNDVINELIIGPYTNESELINLALWMSYELDIVNDSNWANLIPENGINCLPQISDDKNNVIQIKCSAWNKGLSGFIAWNKNKIYSDEELINYRKPKTTTHKQNLSKSLQQYHSDNNPNSSESTKNKISLAISGENNPMFGKHHTEETLQKLKVPKPRKICPICGIEGPANRMGKYHQQICIPTN
jgi:hypothetical protein